MARRRRWLACLLAFAAPATGGCSLLLPWDELSGTGSADSGRAEASVADVATEQGAVEEGRDVASESSPDAGSRGDSAYPDGSWCAMQAPGMAFCDDFDFETTTFERWSSHVFEIQGSARLSTTAESPPHAFELTSGAITPNLYYREVLEESVAPEAASSTISLSFAFQPAAAWDAGGGQEMYVATISQGPGAPRSDVWLELGPDGTGMNEQITGADGGVTFPPQSWTTVVANTGHWTHVMLQVDLAKQTASVTLDGAPAGALSLQGTWSAAAGSNVYLGDWYLPATPAFDLLYDDAVIRLQ